MKKLLLITVILVLTVTNLMAQNKSTIEIKENKNNQFKITAHEGVDINLKFILLKGDVFKVLILNKGEKIQFSKEYHNEGENKVDFIMEEEEQYTVKFMSIDPIKLIAKSYAVN
jgi:c-di-GMP-binding flagellar brake protein YcgR